MNKATSTCTACSDGCSVCSGPNTCLVCAKGTYKYIKENITSGNGFVYCLRSACPSGTKPSTMSLYYLNKGITTDADYAKEKEFEYKAVAI